MKFSSKIFSTELDTRIIAVHSPKIRNRIRFALISDLHSSRYGDGQQELIDAVRAGNIDAVLYAGDIFDSRQSDTPTLELLSGLSEYPSFFVTGNHEMKNTDADKNRAAARSFGICVLQGNETSVEINSQRITVCGVDDIYDSEEEFLSQIENVRKPLNDDFRIFILHNPEIVSVYEKVTADLFVCGHVHGGQWRLPFINRGLVSPRRTLFPKYSSGLYGIGNAKLIVSRGLSKTSTRIPRIFNRPEIIFIDVCPSHQNI
ncbi:MAG: metallophosphoesterase [Oscillospiraceae bacterium]|nr:metallophosphoesterase [Oscillospiraceae bacterium]